MNENQKSSQLEDKFDTFLNRLLDMVLDELIEENSILDELL